MEREGQLGESDFLRLESRPRPAPPITPTAHLRLRLPGGAAAVPSARRALAGLEFQLGRDLHHDVALIVTELVANSVRHGQLGDANWVRFEVTVSQRHVRVEIEDRGPGFSPEPPPADRERAGKWGLIVVDRLSSRWGVARDDGTLVWAEIDRAAAA